MHRIKAREKYVETYTCQRIEHPFSSINQGELAKMNDRRLNNKKKASNHYCRHLSDKLCARAQVREKESARAKQSTHQARCSLHHSQQPTERINSADGNSGGIDASRDI